MYKKVNVVMLPTNEKATICLSQNKLSLFYGIEPDIEKLKYQHLYITSDEEINGGDWCLNSYDNQIWKYKPSPCPLPYWGNKDTLTKIIATTDKSITINGYDSSDEDAIVNCYLPQIPQEFIELYCQKYNEGNSITEVEILYEPNYSNLGESLWYPLIESNKVKIRLLKNCWTRDEVVELCRSAHLHGEQGALNLHYQIFKQWIEENL